MPVSYYPKSPTNISKELTGLTAAYQFKAILAIVAILLFFVLYSTLVAALGYLVYLAITYEMNNIHQLSLLMKIGAVLGSVMLFVFTLKFIFKLKNHKPTNRIKLKKEEHPYLWSFVDQICKETGAPKPKSIYVDPDVNAYVSYTNIWLSLFLPVQKDLTIGLALTSCLNLSEFKAVMSHEFGHFAQRSMKIGSYIMSANTIIHDMIFTRDKWDDILEQWKASDIRLSVTAWAIMPVIWVIRQSLKLFYQFLNVMYSSLSREMEFNADKVAISTSGSDAIISALWKLNDGFANWNGTIHHAYLASKKKIFVKNLYTHNSLAIERNADNQIEELNSLPQDKRGGKLYFSSSEHSNVNMYATHPPNDKRQDNAKIPYIICDEDERSPWILFGNKEQLQEEMTTLLYQEYMQKSTDVYASSDGFEQFIIEEKKGKELLEEYHNTFAERFFHIPAMQELDTQIENIEDFSSLKLKQLKADLEVLMEPINTINELIALAHEIANGTTKQQFFTYEGRNYTKDNLEKGYTALVQQKSKLFSESFKEWDASFCTYHLALAKQKGKSTMLVDLYNQYTVIGQIYLAIMNRKGSIFQELEQIQAREDLTQKELYDFGRWVNNTVVGLNEVLNTLDKITFIPMPNIDTVEELKEVIIEGGKFQREVGKIFENGGFDKLVFSLDTAISNCQRIDQKGIAAILSYHKTLQQN